ncbi:hypothetical protein BDZ85DRAFT_266326 [Elsinoe ampelina]|uniref:Uncharacterized protein n=1 Tax=Elsinoe ampelina TaxID=302913 RepID=A0A6A6G5V1_9PEZI|nr:hypothetical protein BDZ85DRAFT_266326 [Elsinoe ampelina]
MDKEPGFASQSGLHFWRSCWMYSYDLLAVLFWMYIGRLTAWASPTESIVMVFLMRKSLRSAVDAGSLDQDEHMKSKLR